MEEIAGLASYAPDVGATIVIFALLIYAYRQQQQQHEREMARTQENAETMRQVIQSLMDCLKAQKTPRD